METGYDVGEEHVKDVEVEEDAEDGHGADAGEHEGSDESPELQTFDSIGHDVGEVDEEATEHVVEQA